MNANHQLERKPPRYEWPWTVASILALMALWELGITLFQIPPFILPHLKSVASALLDHFDLLAPHALATLGEIVAGFAISSAAGIGIAIWIHSSPFIRRTLYPLIVGMQMVPKIAFAPLLVMWFGFGFLPKVAIAALIAFFPVVLNTLRGLQSVEIETLYLARSMGATKGQIFQKILFPNALPNIFTGLKMASTLAVIGAIVGEFIATDRGLGRILLISNMNMDTALLFAAVILLSLLGIALYLLVVLNERIFIRWYVLKRSQER